MATQQINNPRQVNVAAADYRLLKSDAGEPLLPRTVHQFLAIGAISVGNVVALVGPSGATVKPGVSVKATALPYASVVGVYDGKVAAVDGDVVDVVTWGLAFVSVGAAAPAIGDTATIQANSGDAAVDVDDADATAIAGTLLGGYLATKNASNIAPVWVNQA